MLVLVTGATGYLGVGVVKQLLDLGVDVVATDFKNSDRLDSRAKFVQGNIFELDNPFEYFNKPDVLVHLAWRNGFVHNADSHLEDLPKHYSFIEKMVKSGLKQFVGMGSMHEIGFYEGSINENTPCNPSNLYGISKDALRKATELLCKNNDVIFQWTRAYYIVGNSEYGSSIFSKLISANKNGQEKFPFTSGLNQYDFLNYQDCCHQIAAVAVQKNVVGIINICNGRPEKLKDRVEQFIKENCLNISLDYGKYPDRPYDSKAVWGDNSKIELILDGVERDLEKE